MLADRCLCERAEQAATVGGWVGGAWGSSSGRPTPQRGAPHHRLPAPHPRPPQQTWRPRRRRHRAQPTAHTLPHAHISRCRRQTRRGRENTPNSHSQTHTQTTDQAGAAGNRRETEVRLKAPKTPGPSKRPAAFCPRRPLPGSLSPFWAMGVTPRNPGQPVWNLWPQPYLRASAFCSGVLRDGGPGLTWVPPS